jgi:hypothetical protein
MLINPTTFITTEIDADGDEVGTVEVTLRGQTKVVPARRFKSGSLTARGVVGRYQSATKVWPACIYLRGDRESVHFGRDDNHPKFRKENNIWFEAVSA